MRQYVVENDKIFYALREELLKATKEIVVVSSWFTDTELISILAEKQSSGVNVFVVISDNSDNSEVDYTPITNAGGKLIRVRIDKGGMMHQKFCIIDSRVAIHGSYNWTLNARKRNNESVILTEHEATIKALSDTYNSIVNMIDDSAGVKNHSWKKWFKRTNAKTDRMLVEKNENPSNNFSSKSDLEFLLDEMIESEIFKFDKESLSKEGFKRSQLTNGDHQTLPNTLDTLYADFVNSLNLATEKKESLSLKINEAKKHKTSKVTHDRDLDINLKEAEFQSKDTVIEREVVQLQSEVRKGELDIENIRNTEISSLEKDNEDISKEIENLQIGYVHTKIRWFELIPLIVLGIVLLAYLIVFYSSAAYILIFSTADAKLAQMQNMIIPPPEVFDPKAIGKALDKGGTAPYFMGLFVVIPISLALVRKFLPNPVSFFKSFTIWLSIFLVDAILAYTVSKSIHDVEYLSGKVSSVWQFSDFYKNENFYLVFVLGALGLIMFKIIYEKFHLTFEERNKDSVRSRNQRKVSILKKTINRNNDRINRFESNIAEISKSILEYKASISEKEKERISLPILIEKEKQFIIKKAEQKITEIEDIISLYMSRIENNDLKFSTSALIDRINTFIEGWVNYLHDNYSIRRAVEMSNNATITKNQWLEAKVKQHGNK
ncbi:phospholipase D-like domain-containing protein [Sunxiuqinia elliptica]|uniref:phospholipase D n=1 Tax=Sunxiuqinia elliptica TaxID=655355 RepID=A0A4R6HA85_9BACT|nr:phospholipase D-like domain-containing protein [Sunxiuqinia elliptica]TDO05423.1 phospholipase D-like protein [Sunxiuqinia elliptica]TDO64969.1 phospholipase D-like protein [Sunxiuqinia elliptica]